MGKNKKKPGYRKDGKTPDGRTSIGQELNFSRSREGNTYNNTTNYGLNNGTISNKASTGGCCTVS